MGELLQQFEANEILRRGLANEILVNTVSAWLGEKGLAACNSGLASGKTTVAKPKPARKSDQSNAPHLVGIGYDERDPLRALNNALDQTVGLSRIQRGDSVYLRVNSNSGDPYPYSTSPQVIVAIGQLLADIGVTDIRIGDRSFWGDPNTAGNLRDNGIAEAAKTLGTQAVVFDDAVEWIVLPTDSLPSWRGTIRIPKLVATATHFINLACVKTHFIAHITMCLKLALGLINATDRSRPGNLDTHVLDRLWPQIAEVNKQITPTLNVLDGYRAVITGGPTVRDKPPLAPGNWQPQTATPKVFVVSTDRIATDVVGAAILQTLSPTYEEVQQHAPFSLPQIRTAIAAGGLGIGGPDALDIAGPSVPVLEQYRANAMRSH